MLHDVEVMHCMDPFVILNGSELKESSLKGL